MLHSIPLNLTLDVLRISSTAHISASAISKFYPFYPLLRSNQVSSAAWVRTFIGAQHRGCYLKSGPLHKTPSLKVKNTAIPIHLSSQESIPPFTNPAIIRIHPPDQTLAHGSLGLLPRIVWMKPVVLWISHLVLVLREEYLSRVTSLRNPLHTPLNQEEDQQQQVYHQLDGHMMLFRMPRASQLVHRRRETAACTDWSQIYLAGLGMLTIGHFAVNTKSAGGRKDSA